MIKMRDEIKVVTTFEVNGRDCWVLKLPVTETETGKEVLHLEIVASVGNITDYKLER